ncbi:MAG: hypothetical protein GY943_04585 [Chloroflexi bacterium]|nr:hypothetical protein [Chloroflexota bacterium]
MKQYRRVERQHPIFSPVAIISTLILAFGLGLGVYFTGGRAFSPGDLSALNYSGASLADVKSHAEIADDCNQCHVPFEGLDAALCEACHENIATERQTTAKLHGRFPTPTQCETCHLEHRGENYDLKTAALLNFDHTLTNFALDHHLLDFADHPLDCTSCHMREGQFDANEIACLDCHVDAESEFMQRHGDAYGTDCQTCHDGHDTMADFDAGAHEKTFPLTGTHLETTCESCHAGGEFADKSKDCVSCHAEPDTHRGMFGVDCVDCHTTTAWKPAGFDGVVFDHARDTRFSLMQHATDYDGASFTCQGCHKGADPIKVADVVCVDCHETAVPDFLPAHITLFSADCQSCHDGSGDLIPFDHNQVWTLGGQHAVQECTTCHVNQTFAGTPADCVGCHAEPPIHLGVFGIDCANCHTDEAWLPARLRQHSFPLNHGEQGELDCATCHTETTYTTYTCTTCHEHNPEQVQQDHDELNLTQTDLLACATCHPTGITDEADD